MTHDEVNNLRVGDVVEYSPAGPKYQVRWTVRGIVRQAGRSVVDIFACNNDHTQSALPASINITDMPKYWTLIEKAKEAKEARPDVHPLEQLRQRLDSNNDSS